MKKNIVLLFISLIPILTQAQDVSNIHPYEYIKGVNLCTLSDFTKDSTFTRIFKSIKSRGLEFDVIDNANGIITTKPRVMTDATNFSYSLRVYFEKEDVKVRVFASSNMDVTVFGAGMGFSSGQTLEQSKNEGLAMYKWGFRYLVFWSEEFKKTLNCVATYSKE